MKSFVVALFSFSFLFVLAACTTMHKKAEAFMEAGSYEEAVNMYEQLLQKDPGDADATIGLKKARTKLVEKRLIDIRNTRLSSNEAKSIEMLEDVLRKEQAWKESPGGAVAYTQTEESEYSGRYLAGQIRQANAAKTPLRSAYLTIAFRSVYSTLENSKRTELDNETKEAGKKSCDAYKKTKSTKRPYYSEFIQKYCGYWGDKSQGESYGAKINEGLWQGLVLQNGVSGLSNELAAVIESQLFEALKDSAWYDVAGKGRLNLRLGGVFEFKRLEAPVALSHSYSVTIPYTDYEDVTRYRSAPYQDTEYVYNAYSKKSEPRSVTKYRQESYQERVAVTKYRNEPRVHHFTGTRVSENARLDLSGKANLKDNDLALSFTRELNLTQDTHAVSMPTIGLQPVAPNLPDRSQWISHQAAEMKQELRKKLVDLWLETYCVNDARALKNFAEEELVLRCLRQPLAQFPAFATNWFTANFGLTIPEANQVFGFIARKGA